MDGEETFSCAVITLSDKGAAGDRVDTSGQALQRLLRESGYRVDYYTILPDRHDVIVEALKDCADRRKIDLIVTTGGTGVSPSDVTPEATREVLDKEIPGMAEAMRSASLKKTIHAVISRGVAGIRKNSLIINLPGSEKGALENIEAVLAALPHAIAKIRGDKSDCGVTPG